MNIQPLISVLKERYYDETDTRKLVILLGQLGDFDSLEYAMEVVKQIEKLEAADISLLFIGIGNEVGKACFCKFTGLSPKYLLVIPTPTLHNQLGLYSGLNLPVGPWTNMLLMCAGVGSPNTIQEVFRGYTGDRNASPRLQEDESIKIGFLPEIQGRTFSKFLGTGFLRPFELASLRLRNMIEVLSNWECYMPSDRYLTQRGATFFLDKEYRVIYYFRQKSILGYSKDMRTPLAFFDSLL